MAICLEKRREIITFLLSLKIFKKILIFFWPQWFVKIVRSNTKPSNDEVSGEEVLTNFRKTSMGKGETIELPEEN